MANWYNPFKRIRALNDEIAKLNAELDYWIEEEKQAREQAFYEARQYFQQRTVMLQAQNEQLLERIVTINNMAPQPLYALRDAKGQRA